MTLRAMYNYVGFGNLGGMRFWQGGGGGGVGRGDKFPNEPCQAVINEQESILVV